MTDETTTPPAAAPAEKPVAKVLGDRTRRVPLEWPVEYDGKVYDAVTVSRMSGEQISAFYADEVSGRLPMFDCPFEVIDALDADDAMTVQKAVLDFLPRSMREAIG